MEQEAVADSIFPPPPARHALFTEHNLRLLGLLNERLAETHQQGEGESGNVLAAEERLERQRELLKDQKDVPEDVDLKDELEPPRVDWIEEEGFWRSFGETWPITERLLSLEESGVPQLYPKDSPDPRPPLHALLLTILHTYLSLLSSLATTAPDQDVTWEPPTYDHPEGRWTLSLKNKALIEHIRVAATNMHHLCNELRPVQARETLKLMLQAQLDRRKRETQHIRSKCASIRETLSTLKTLL